MPDNGNYTYKVPRTYTVAWPAPLTLHRDLSCSFSCRTIVSTCNSLKACASKPSGVFGIGTAWHRGEQLGEQKFCDNNPVSSLGGKVVLVTGAAKRIGRGIALQLSREGASVAIHYGGSESEARQTADECGGASLFQADLTKVSDIERMFAQIRDRMGRLDGLVNNAARFTRFHPFDLKEEDWDFIHSVNLKAVFFCCQQGAKLMLETGGGHIVNISSLGGIRPWADHAHYCASKAGVIHMTRALSIAFAPDISVNSVAPGVIPFGESEEPRIKSLIDKTPARRAGTAGEVAEAVIHFLTASKFVTGQLIAVDGGLSQT
ncbi:MAG: SDR family oxidoreductase [Bryobacteraceae bacterium]|nr:SDR family oxidoreductase [Bryobacteraceae bacterium]